MKLSEKMNRSTFIRGSSKVIFSVNYSHIATVTDIAELNTHVLTIIEKMPKRSMLLMLDTRGLCVNGEVLGYLKEIFSKYAPYFLASAVIVGSDNEKPIRALADELGFTKMAICRDEEAAKAKLLAGSSRGAAGGSGFGASPAGA